MSKIAPQNARIEFKYDEFGRQYVYKKYHARYTSREEFVAYQKLSACVQEVNSSVRLAKVYDVDDSDNSISIEYINYQNLEEILVSCDINILTTIQDALIELFYEARCQQVMFDSDPSNLLCKKDGTEIVIIDPLALSEEEILADPRLRLKDYSAVVFIWGLVKFTLRNPKIWQSFEILKACLDYYRKYILKSKTEFKSINDQIAIYIGLAISWNIEKNGVEGTIKRLIRCIVVVPIYSFVRLLFTLNFIRP
jgi:hypothetical protein